MGRDHPPPTNAETDDWVFSSGISPGALLKREREKRGLSHVQISQQIRLRPHFLEAIENEEWDLLPAPTLVKGFIRSYARVLGLDEERILDLYREESGADHFSQEFVLPSIPQRKKWPFIIAGLLIVLAAAFAFYVWFLPPIDSTRAIDTNAVKIQESTAVEPSIKTDEQEKPQNETVVEETLLSSAPLEPAGNAINLSPEPENNPESRENESAKPAEFPIADEEKPKAEIPSDVVGPETLKLTLKGLVKERTWLSISIDGLKSKEYVFAPSDTPQWQAEKGFELLIGNAGGIDLEFNGKKLDNLGKQGQVVRMKLPEEEERSSASD